MKPTVFALLVIMTAVAIADNHATISGGGTASSHPSDKVQVVRRNRLTVIKEVFPDSIRMEFIEKTDGKTTTRTATYHLDDIIDERHNGKGATASIIIVTLPGKEKEVVTAIEGAGLKVAGGGDEMLVVSFPKKDPPFAKIQSLFMNRAVLYVEPNAQRGID